MSCQIDFCPKSFLLPPGEKRSECPLLGTKAGKEAGVVTLQAAVSVHIGIEAKSPGNRPQDPECSGKED